MDSNPINNHIFLKFNQKSSQFSSLLKKPMNVAGKSSKSDLEIPKEIPLNAYMLTPDNDKNIIPIFIDIFLNNQMRPHQKEGVKFMFECICGFRGSDIDGCILAVLLTFIASINCQLGLYGTWKNFANYSINLDSSQKK